MVRTTIYLSDDVHKALRHLAVERRQSMADLLRRAVEEVYEDDLKDLLTAQRVWRKHLKAPQKAIEAREYFARRAKKRV